MSQHFTYLSELASWMQSKSRQLSYDGRDGPLKHQLREASHALNGEAVKVSNGVIRNARGSKRKLTLRERTAIWILDGRTEVRP